jgi:hypothetical protein
MGLFKVVLVSSCLVLLWNPSACCDDGAQLILSLDLRTFGYRRPVAEREFRAYAFLQDSVVFLNEEILAVSFYRKNDHPGLPRRDGTPGSEVVFHSVLLDPATGSVRAQRPGVTKRIGMRCTRLRMAAFSFKTMNG